MKSPFKFLDSYTREDRAIFFGRDQEITELYRKVFESKILLVYGISGTGKSSLVNCGLASRFDESDWLPVNVRRGSNIIESLNDAFNKQAIRPLKKSISVSEKLQSIYLDHFKPVFIIFDQFEELFIFGDKEERKAFIQIVKSLLDPDLKCRLIFVMREEYMAGVTEFERLIPIFFANRVRIEKMSHRNALEAIKEPCKVFKINLEEGFAEALLDKLSPEETDVELTYLQVFLDKIFRLAGGGKDGSPVSFNLSLFEKAGDVSDLLGSFLEEQLKALNEPDTGLSVLKTFVSLKGTKRQLSQREVIESSRAFGKDIPTNKTSDLLQKFVNLRILRDKDENDKYELRHDSLATKIYEKITIVEKEMLEICQFLENALNSYQKRKVLLSTNDLKYIAPYADRLFVNKNIIGLIDLSKKEKDKIKRRIKRIAFSGFIAILIFSFGSIGMVYKWPAYYQIMFLSFILYVFWFLPVFGYYVIKTRDNRAMNMLFMIFTLVFIGNIYLLSTNLRDTRRAALTAPAIQNEQKVKDEIERYQAKADSVYSIFYKQFNKFSDQLRYLKYDVDAVEQRTEELVSYIQDLKIEIVVQCEGPESQAISGKEVDISKIFRDDENNVPTQILIGAKNNGKAFKLSNLIREYKDFLVGLVGNDKVIGPGITKTLDFKYQKTKNPYADTSLIKNWEQYTFLGRPLLIVISTLSQIQADIKYCESEVITYLYNKILAETEQKPK